jgi:hypothetical protein
VHAARGMLLDHEAACGRRRERPRGSEWSIFFADRLGRPLRIALLSVASKVWHDRPMGW